MRSPQRCYLYTDQDTTGMLMRLPRLCYSVPVTPSRQFEPRVRDTLPLSIAITRLPRFYGIIIDDLGRGRRDCQSVLGTPSIDPSKWI